MFTSVRLQGFRSYVDETYELSDSVTIIVGPNASGKTNLLEALLVLSTGKSFRASDKELIKHASDWARLDGGVGEDSRVVKLRFTEDTKAEKSIELDGRSVKRLKLHEILPVVLFEPEHLRLLRGSPKRRREFLDELLSRLVPGYQVALRGYERALLQRNTLLKQQYVDDAELFVWNVRLSEYGSKLREARARFVEENKEALESLYKDIAGDNNKKLDIMYSNPTSHASALLRELEKNQTLDRDRGYTSEGPHRDDLYFFMDSKHAHEVASRGETRTILLALKILEVELLEKLHNQKPLILLDDVFSELDGARRQALTKRLKGYQTVITTTDADAVIEHFMGGDVTIIPLGSK